MFGRILETLALRSSVYRKQARVTCEFLSRGGGGGGGGDAGRLFLTCNPIPLRKCQGAWAPPPTNKALRPYLCHVTVPPPPPPLEEDKMLNGGGGGSVSFPVHSFSTAFKVDDSRQIKGSKEEINDEAECRSETESWHKMASTRVGLTGPSPLTLVMHGHIRPVDQPSGVFLFLLFPILFLKALPTPPGVLRETTRLLSEPLSFFIPICELFIKHTLPLFLFSFFFFFFPWWSKCTDHQTLTPPHTHPPPPQL